MNLFDDDLKIDKIVEDDVPNRGEKIVDFLKSHIWIGMILSILIVFSICFLSVAMHINTHYDKLGSADERKNYYQILSTFFITFIVAFFAWGISMYFLIRPIFKIREEMQSIKDGNLYKQIEIKGTHEIWQLAKLYNDMASELGNQRLECSYEREEKQRAISAKHAAERRSLEYIINTNFVYGITDYLISNKDQLADDKEKEIISILNTVLKYVSNSYSDEVNIGTEIKWIDKYLYLAKILHGDLFDYEIDLPDNLAGWPSLKLLLLPFVENSIEHGFSDVKEGGMIKIFASELHNKLILNIWDNGKGFDEDALKEINAFINNHNNYEYNDIYNEKNTLMRSLSNLYDFYGNRFDIKINTMKDDGTCITMFLPLPNRFSWQGLEQ